MSRGKHTKKRVKRTQDQAAGKPSFVASHYRLVMTLMAVFAVAALLFSLFVMNGLGWFKFSKELDGEMHLTDFSLAIEYKIGTGSWTPYDETQGVDVGTADTPLFRVTYTGKSAAYLRVHLEEMFYDSRIGTAAPLTSVGAAQIDNGGNWEVRDGYAYYTPRLENPDIENQGHISSVTDQGVIRIDESKLPVLSDFVSVRGRIFIVAEAVQPDRRDAVWQSSATTAQTTTTTETVTTVPTKWDPVPGDDDIDDDDF